ncbi:conserved hypothetical protein [Echinococcus multilocularis]|uniref:Uncharacterized protein n=1 Tax=Echinococcus multilocularis TaxID=6211 RepID=A0A068XVN5_ECHMU|nr:conserved hypothetical protein [Echinococcus multilocularis]
MDNRGPSVFRVEKAFDMRPGYQPAEATLSVVYNTTNTNSTENASPEAQEAIATSQAPLIVNPVDPEALIDKKSTKEMVLETPSASNRSLVEKECLNRSSISSVCTDQCQVNQDKLKKPEEPCERLRSQRSSISQPPPPSPEGASNEMKSGGECQIKSSTDSLIERFQTQCFQSRRDDEMIFDTGVYRDRINGKFPEDEYPPCRLYTMNRRNGAINMVLETMHNIEAHIMCGYVKDQHDKCKLQEMLLKARQIIGPNRQTSLTYAETKELMRLLCTAKAYVINGCASECCVNQCNHRPKC